MASLSIILKIPMLFVDIKKDLTNKTAGSICFIKKAFYHEVTKKLV